MRVRAAVGFCVAVLTSASVASATTLTTVNGRVLVNPGSGYVPGASQTQLKSGDQVFATNGASAIIVYDNGCIQRVDAGKVVTVLSNPQCPTTAESAFNGPDIGTGLVVGGIVVGAGVAAAVALTGNGSSSGSSSKPASP